MTVRCAIHGDEACDLDCPMPPAKRNPARRPIVTLHLPLEMGSVGRILQVVGTFYPDATVGPGDDSSSLVVEADPDAVALEGMRVLGHPIEDVLRWKARCEMVDPG